MFFIEPSMPRTFIFKTKEVARFGLNYASHQVTQNMFQENL